MIFDYLLIKLGNTFKKEKELNKGFSLFNFSLLSKGLFKLFIKQLNYQKLKKCFLITLSPILVHWTHMWCLDPRKLKIMENNKG
jgi:hypothetical protein